MSRAAKIRFLAETVMQWKHVCDIQVFERTVSLWVAGRYLAWDPFTSESDCAALLKALPEEKRGGVMEDLEKQWLRTEEMGPKWFLLTATPEQRTNAVLRAYGYEEGKNG